MPATALHHCQEDIARAKAIVAHADPLPRGSAAEQLLRSDLLRGAWMFAVGGLDAYFCDAYTDLIAATISSKSRQPAIVLPEYFYEIKFPIRAMLYGFRRGAVRSLRLGLGFDYRVDVACSVQDANDFDPAFYGPIEGKSVDPQDT